MTRCNITEGIIDKNFRVMAVMIMVLEAFVASVFVGLFVFLVAISPVLSLIPLTISAAIITNLSHDLLAYLDFKNAD